ncbi:uncharacterized protein BJ212DRAFT_1301502 [Suillus subaureus]|uniref:HMG box domain-containing protein n=1 Tax=Suillus subaureus TaxID=48587 RepID=A0A9P7E6C3_9AGAM|nr:uncharacterized protein BJ212DRAFT_1301502 [Suillus subaureus]KAG1812517.1 hypothetical protein BJ212DRAFT_1301502 [Suillus subaureus]
MTGPIRSKGKGRATDDEELKHLPQSQPPRPPNAWILYRSDKIKVLPPAAPGQRSRAQADVSKLISDMWRNESDAVKLEYERLADARKAEHQRLYPDYRFQPMKKEEKERLREEKRQLKERAREKRKPRGRSYTAAGSSQEQHQAVAPHPIQEAEPQQAAIAHAHPYLLPGVMPVQDVPPHIPHHDYTFLDPGMQFGLAGPSPPLSAASSPNPSSASESSSIPDDLLFRVDALPSVRVSPVSDAQPQPSQQLYLPPFPHPHNLYGMEPMPVQQPQAAYTQWQTLQEHILPQPSGAGSAQESEHMWDQFAEPEGTFDYQQQDFLNFDLTTANNLESIHVFERSLQAMLSSTGHNGIFNMSNVNPADILAQPEGELQVEMGPEPDAQSQELENYYNGFDIETAFATSQEQQSATVSPSGTVNPADTVINTTLSADDFTSFFKPNPDVQAYIATQQRQRQPSAFTRDMLQYINFDAGEGGSQNAAAPQVGAPPPPQAQSPIFTQMTNTAAVSQSGYVPPAGAAHSSTRRVAASWKPCYAVPDDSVIDPALFY